MAINPAVTILIVCSLRFLDASSTATRPRLRGGDKDCPCHASKTSSWESICPIAQHSQPANSSRWPGSLPPLHLVCSTTSARLTLFSALNLTQEFLLMLEEKYRTVVLRKVEDEASQILAGLTQEARESGVEARGVFVCGQGWFELVSQASDNHDLVLLGSSGAPPAARRHHGKESVTMLSLSGSGLSTQYRRTTGR